MRYLWYGFLGLFSIGFLGAIASIIGFFYVLNYYGDDLPDYSQLKNYEPPIVTRLYAGDGHLLAEFAEEKRIFVPIEFIPDRVKQAFIAAEDQNFYTHQGVDLKAVLRAVVINLKNAGSGRRPEGASTISQQVAKNFFLNNDVNYVRKIKEAILAYRMDKTLGKNQILELYLNEIYLGGGAYGVAAAAQYYFDKSLEELNISEVAYLATLPKAPNNYHPVRNHDKALERRNWVIGRMYEDKYITEAEAELASLVPLAMVDKSKTEQVHAPYFAEEVRRELAARYGEDSLYKGGLAVKTSVDPTLQAIAQKSLRIGLMGYDTRHGYRGAIKKLVAMEDWRKQLEAVARPHEMLPEWSFAAVLDVSKDSAKLGFIGEEQGVIKLEDTKWARKYLNEGYAQGPEIASLDQVVTIGDVIMVEKKTASEEKPDADKEKQEAKTDDNIYLLRQIPDVQGAVVALDPHTGRVLAMQGGWGYDSGGSEFNRATQAQRQPGSAFKPFVYLAALDKGFTPATLILDAPFVLTDPVTGRRWSPVNYSREYYGPTTLRVGIEKSRNLMTVRLADFLGMELVAKYSDHFGITDKMQPFLSNALGSTETTVMRMTAAYGMLVNGGKKITPTLIDRIQDRRGKTIFKHDNRPCERCGTKIKWENQAVPDVPDTREQIADPRTTYQMVSILQGVVQRGTAARLNTLGRPLAGKTGTTNESRDTWFIGFSPDLVVGVFVGFDNPRSMGKHETGASTSVPVFEAFMKDALAGQPPTPFRRPSGLRSVLINAETGKRARPGDVKILWEDFVIGSEPTDENFVLGADGITRSSYAQSHGADMISGEGDGGTPSAVSNSVVSPSYVPPAVIPANPVTTGTGGLY